MDTKLLTKHTEMTMMCLERHTDTCKLYAYHRIYPVKAIFRPRSADSIQIADRPLPDRIQTACLRSADQAKSKKASFPMLMKGEPKCWGAKSSIGTQY